METLARQVGRARRRLLWQSLATKLAWCWFGTLLLAAVAIGCGKFWPDLDQRLWAWGSLGTALAVGLVAAAVWAWSGRLSLSEAAAELDRRCGLKERVSSSLALVGDEQTSPIGQALLRDAEQKVGRVDVAEQFGVRLDRRSWLPVLPAGLAAALAVFVPVRVPEAQQPKQPAASGSLQTSTRELTKKLAAQRKEAAEKGLKEVDALLEKIEAGTKKLAETPKTDHKQTLLVLNDLVKDAERRKEQLAGASDMKEQLSQLKNLGQGPAEKLGQAMKNGDFEKAAKELEKLKQDLAGDKLSPEGKQALAKQLEQMKQAVAHKAEAHEKQVQELRERVESERQAGNAPEADKLQQQLDKLAGQKPQMQQLAQMAQQLGQAAQQLEQGNSQQAAEALEQLGEQLGQMDQELAEMEMLDGTLQQLADSKRAMACSQCDGEGCSECQGKGKSGNRISNRWSDKDGGDGIGTGVGRGVGPETKLDAKFYDSGVKQKPGQGGIKVIGDADGPNRKGRVLEAIQSEFSAAEQNASDALSEQKLPHDYRDHAQDYFDALREGPK